MPAAAVIPAPIVYIKVVAVKKLVVGLSGGSAFTVITSVCATSGSYRVAVQRTGGHPRFGAQEPSLAFGRVTSWVSGCGGSKDSVSSLTGV